MNFLHVFRISASQLGYRPNEPHNTLSLFMLVTISFTNHNYLVFWARNLSYQITCHTISFRSSHKGPMLAFERNETWSKFRKSTMCNIFTTDYYETCLLPSKLRVGVGTAVENHTRCTVQMTTSGNVGRMPQKSRNIITTNRIWKSWE